MIFHPRMRKISKYLDGMLSDKEGERLQTHFAKCEACHKKVQLLDTSSRFCQLPKDKLEAVSKNVMEKIEPKKWHTTAPIIGEIQSVMGIVLIKRNSDEEGIEAFPGLSVRKGDYLVTIGDSKALVELTDRSQIFVNKETRLDFITAQYNLLMRAGEIFAMMKPQKKTFEIKTPAAVLGVIGTDFDAQITNENDTILKVLKGKVSFQNDAGKTVVKKRRQVEAAKYTPPTLTKIRETRSITNWTAPIRPKKSKGFAKNLSLLILIVAIVFVGILYFAKLQKPATPDIIKLDKTDPLELASPYRQAGMSWRTKATVQLQDQKWVDFYETVIRSDVISVDEDNGARVLITIEDVKVSGDFGHNEVRLGMIGRQFEYRVSPEGNTHSYSIADGKPVEYAEIEFYGDVMGISDMSGLFQKNVLTPGDQWTVQFEDKVPGYPSSYIKEVEKYQFVNYEIENGIEYAIVRSDVTGSVGGNIPVQRHIEPKAIHYGYLDQLTVNQKWEYRIDVKSGRVVSGSAISQSSDIKGRVTSIIQGRRVPITEKIEQPSGDVSRAFITVEYLP